MADINRRRRALAQAAAIGSEPAGSTGEAFRARVEGDIRKWKALSGKAELDA